MQTREGYQGAVRLHALQTRAEDALSAARGAADAPETGAEEVGCARRTFVEQLPGLVARRGSITTRAVGWAIGQLRREHATLDRLGTRVERRRTGLLGRDAR